ncbi:hypothetical protein SK128_005173, partial [Halocaridina rubra]
FVLVLIVRLAEVQGPASSAHAPPQLKVRTSSSILHKSNIRLITKKYYVPVVEHTN